jgi:hypothetical protein
VEPTSSSPNTCVVRRVGGVVEDRLGLDLQASSADRAGQ